MAYFLLIDKPAGITSHDVVDRVRRLTGERRVGHAGTLDPFATGLLIVAVGREATRELSRFVGLDKHYEATFVLGARSDTDDATGTITPVVMHHPPTPEQIGLALSQFQGEIEQIPPAYSAIKIDGKKMYEAARAGKPLEAKPRRVRIFEIRLLASPTTAHAPESSFNSEEQNYYSLFVTIHCSSGTYIRAIARDLGHALGTGGYVQSLRRTAVGPFTIEKATALDQILPLPISLVLSQVLSHL